MRDERTIRKALNLLTLRNISYPTKKLARGILLWVLNEDEATWKEAITWTNEEGEHFE